MMGEAKASLFSYKPLQEMFVEKVAPMGTTKVFYGEPMAYQSSLKVDECFPSIVTYQCARTGQDVGRVYKNSTGRWFLASRYLNHFEPVEVFSKYNGYLFLLSLHKKYEDKHAP